MSRRKVIFFILILMVILQAARMALEQSVFLIIERNKFTDSMASAFSMLILTAAFASFAKWKREPLSLFPQKFGRFYIGATVIFFALVAASFLISEERTLKSMALIVFFCIVTPIFEEIVFRGYIWNKLSSVFERQWQVLAISALLFGIWHLGYFETVAFRAQGNLAWIMLWKTITGLVFGIALGAARMKTKNCYLTILLHGAMNLFGR